MTKRESREARGCSVPARRRVGPLRSEPDLYVASYRVSAVPEAGSEKELELISAVKHVTEAFPPVFVMTCVDDFLKAQPSVFIPELIRNDIPHVFRFYGSKTNRLGHVFHCNIKTADAKLCNDEECDFFRRYISLKGSL